ncbi:MAG: Rho termination factor N-terminal domain-containing protein, partial [Anaerococcus hydrogenalis]|nr:Rho termination factor N-terminal domain-containing protein [Anaerococcus hydrogenalis]
MDIDLNKLDRLKLDELKQIAKDLSIKSVSSYRKNDLIELIKDT